MRVAVLFVGDESCPEFQGAADWLRTRTSVRFESRIDPQTPLDFDPDQIVVAQAQPGRFSNRDLEILHARWPLAPIVGLLGPWCEGEIRSGKPWPGVPRIYWHQWRPRFERYFVASPESAPWRMPKSAADTESMLARRLPNSRVSVSAIVDATARRYEFLADMLTTLGMCVHDAKDDARGPASCRSNAAHYALLFDSPQLGPAACDRLRHLNEVWSPLATIVSTDFVRYHELDEWHKAGASILLARPWLLDDLVWCLEHAAELSSDKSAWRGAA